MEQSSDPGHGADREAGADRPPMADPSASAPPPPPPPPASALPPQWNVPGSAAPPPPQWGAPAAPPHGAPGPHAGWPTPGPDRATGWRWDAGSILIIVGSVGAFIGAFLPWATLGVLSKAGTEGDGVITLILALLGGLLGFGGISRGRSGMLVGSLICAALIVLVAIIDIADIGTIGDRTMGLEPDVGSGLLLTLVAGGCGVLGAILALVTQRRSP